MVTSLHLLMTFAFCLIAVSAGAQSDTDAEARVFLRGQCKARCLQYFQHSDEATLNKIVNRLGVQGDLASDCFQRHRSNCSDACFVACDAHPTTCQFQCSIGHVDSVGCHLGCLLLSDISPNRPGTCPLSMTSLTERSTTASSFSTACRNTCLDDSSCLHPLQKCCEVDCSRVCTTPHYSDLVPSFSSPLILNSPPKSELIHMSWSGGGAHPDSGEVDEPLVFILQTRVCACKRFTETYASPWQTLIMTRNMEVTLDAFGPGQIYQFRLASVGIHGSRGFGQPSDPYLLLPRPPQPPSPPQNLTATKWRIHPNGEVSIRLNWSPPATSDLPLINYSISWALDQAALHNPRIQPWKTSNAPLSKTVHPDKSEAVISDLQPESSYKVQVKAISHWYGGGDLESEPHTLFVSTKSAPALERPNLAFKGPKHVSSAPVDSRNCKCDGLMKTDERLGIKPPEIFGGDLTAILELKSFSHLDSLSYQIEWFPQVCIASRDNIPLASHHPLADRGGDILTATVRNRIFRLTKLKFNCVYMVRLTPEKPIATLPQKHLHPHPKALKNPHSTPVAVSSAPDIVVGCFCTRSCRETRNAWGTQPLDCLETDTEPPNPPQNIQVELVDYERMDYQISWQAPQPPNEILTPPGGWHPSASNSFTQYRIMWSPRRDEPVDAAMYNDEAGFKPLPDLQHSVVKVVAKNQTSLILSQLRPRTVYILLIQTLGPTVSGRKRESIPAVQYFVTHGGKMHLNEQTAYNALLLGTPLFKGIATQLNFTPLLDLLLPLSIWLMHF